MTNVKILNQINSIENKVIILEKQIKDLSQDYKKSQLKIKQLQSALDSNYKVCYDQITERYNRNEVSRNGK